MNSFSQNDAAVYTYRQKKITEFFTGVIKKNVTPEAWQWLEQKALESRDTLLFNFAFVQTPRKTGRSIININKEEGVELNSIVQGFSIIHWPADRLCRAWLLLQLTTSDKVLYTSAIETLFTAAEMNEQVALYSALPLLAYPQHWKKQCAEGIRSNIGDVLEAIMCCNPYPSVYLEEAAWNQMILKAFFTEKKVHEIIGLDERTNAELANILVDYAHERWAANRTVNPQLWRCVGRFINGKNLVDIERLFKSETEMEKEAAALACHDSSYAPAKVLLHKNRPLKQAIETGRLTWHTLAQKTNASF